MQIGIILMWGTLVCGIVFLIDYARGKEPVTEVEVEVDEWGILNSMEHRHPKNINFDKAGTGKDIINNIYGGVEDV